MLILTINEVPNKKIVEVKGLVRGNTVQSKNLGKDIMAGFKSMVGGELNSYTEMLSESREKAIKRMVSEAEAQGANAIIGMRLASSAIADNAAEIVAYGTAVVVE